VILYADVVTDSMRRALEEFTRRRTRQLSYNLEHEIVPRTIVKSVDEVMRATSVADAIRPDETRCARCSRRRRAKIRSASSRGSSRRCSKRPAASTSSARRRCATVPTSCARRWRQSRMDRRAAPGAAHDRPRAPPGQAPLRAGPLAMLESFLPLVKFALSEDVGTGDVTTLNAVPANVGARAVIMAKARGVISGLEIAQMTFREVDPALHFKTLLKDGAAIEPGVVLAKITGLAGSIMTAERTALNFMMRMCGVATMTRRFVARSRARGR